MNTHPNAGLTETERDELRGQLTALTAELRRWVGQFEDRLHRVGEVIGPQPGTAELSGVA